MKPTLKLLLIGEEFGTFDQATWEAIRKPAEALAAEGSLSRYRWSVLAARRARYHPEWIRFDPGLTASRPDKGDDHG
jgi:hypothetical protein